MEASPIEAGPGFVFMLDLTCLSLGASGNFSSLSILLFAYELCATFTVGLDLILTVVAVGFLVYT